MRRLLSCIALFAGLAVLAGCGFQLRGAYTLPYESIYIAGADYNLIVAGLKRAIRGSGSSRLADTAAEAQATFLPTSDAGSVGGLRRRRLPVTTQCHHRSAKVQGGDAGWPLSP